MKKTTTKAHGRRAAKIRVTSTNKPPLDVAAAAFARLLIVAAQKRHAMPAGSTGATPEPTASMMGESRSDQISALRARLDQAEHERDAWRGNGSRHNYEMACVLVESLKKELAALVEGPRPTS